MNCPFCSYPLIMLSKGDLEFGYCLHKHGIWFDSSELNSLLDFFQSNVNPVVVDETDDQSTFLCAVCEEELEKLYLGEELPIVIECCPYGHGFWIDSEELVKLLNCNHELKEKEFFLFLEESLKTAFSEEWMLQG